jgi:hypothetical protein
MRQLQGRDLAASERIEEVELEFRRAKNADSE